MRFGGIEVSDADVEQQRRRDGLLVVQPRGVVPGIGGHRSKNRIESVCVRGKGFKLRIITRDFDRRADRLVHLYRDIRRVLEIRISRDVVVVGPVSADITRWHQLLDIQRNRIHQTQRDQTSLKRIPDLLTSNQVGRVRIKNLALRQCVACRVDRRLAGYGLDSRSRGETSPARLKLATREAEVSAAIRRTWARRESLGDYIV